MIEEKRIKLEGWNEETRLMIDVFVIAEDALKALEEQAPEVLNDWGKTCWKDGYKAALKDGGVTDWMEESPK